MDKNALNDASHDSTLTYAEEALPPARRQRAAVVRPAVPEPVGPARVATTRASPAGMNGPDRDAHTWELFAMRARVAQARAEYIGQFGGRRERLRRALWVFAPPTAPAALSLWLARHAPEQEQLLLGASVYAIGALCGATIARMLPAGVARTRLRMLDNQLAERERRAAAHAAQPATSRAVNSAS